MDDAWVGQREENKQSFLQHINSVDLAIKFIVENNKEDGAIPFLDTIVNNQKLMVSYLSLYIESPPTQTNIYCGIVTITFQLNIL